VKKPSHVARSLYPFTGRYFERRGLRYHYLDEGEGSPVVMVHGNPTWSFYFRNLVLDLRRDHRVLVPDHMGCGYSSKPDADHYGYRLEDRIDDLEALLESLDLPEPVTLVAHDWGGMIAMGWAARHPGQVARIVLMNTAAFHLPEDMSMPPLLSFVRDTGLAAFLVRRANLFSRGAGWLAPRKRLPREVRHAYAAPYNSPDNRLATLRFVQDIPLQPSDPSYETVSQVERGLSLFTNTPVLLLWGDQDFVFGPKVMKVFEKYWPHAEGHHFPRAGHYVLEDAAAEIPPILRDFLKRHP
jgi:pimeloyl-ACP methyl ester carboxylesterase